MEPHDEQKLRKQLAQLRAEHRALDDEIIVLEGAGSVDQLQITRLKKRKLRLKEQISALEDQIFPDIIA